MRPLIPSVVLLFAPSAQAVEFFSVPGSFLTIQEALDASSSGDTILVEPGTYPERLDFLGKDVLVIGLGGPELNILDAGQTGSAVRFVNGEGPGAILEGFTITGGLLDSTNMQTGSGAGVICIASAPALRNNVIEGNQARWGGGIACLEGAQPEVSGNVVRDNVAENSGGGLFVHASSPQVLGNTVAENEANSGGGIYLATNESQPRIEDNDVVANRALAQGGGIVVDSGSDQGLAAEALLIGNRLRDNQASSAGGLLIAHSAPVVNGNTIQGNQVSGDGGGVLVRQGEPLVTFRGNLVIENMAQGRGAAFWVGEDSACVLESTTLAGNVAGVSGGALSITSAEVTGLDLILAHNQAPAGQEVDLIDASLVAADSCLFGGLAATQSDAQSTLQLRGTVVTSDPLFVAPASSDWRLALGSPCIDNGSSRDMELDLLGTARPVDGDLDTLPRPDMGALEFAPLFLVEPAIPGGALVLELWGASGTSIELWLAFAPIADRTDTPFGSFQLAPSAFPLAPIPAGAPFLLQRGVRSTAPIIGQTLSFQALIDSAAAPAGRAWSNPISFFVQA